MRRFSAFTLLRLIAAMLAAWLASTSLAAAHASLTATVPADGAVVPSAPQRFSLSFSEPVSPLTLRLIRPDGAAVPLARYAVRDRTVEIAAPDELSDGTHVLAWRVVSADGHPVGGSLIFSVREPSAAPPPVAEPYDRTVRAGLWATKVALYAGLFVGIGGVFAIAWLFPRSRPGQGAVAAALAVGFAGTALSSPFQGLDALGADAAHFLQLSVWSAGMGTSYGRTVLGMLVAVLLAALSLLVSSRALARLLSLAALLCGAGALALSGHAGAAEPQWLTRPSVLLHAATIALWAGALLPLGLALHSGAEDAGIALRRFSAFIPPAVLVLVLAGVALAVVQVETPSALADTAYGRLLVAKLALVAVLFALAAWNRWRLTARALTGEGASRRALARVIAAETLIILVIFAIAAGWRFTPPPRALAIAAALPAEGHIHALDAMADVTVTPGRAGPVSISAVLMSGEFGPLDAKEVTFVLSNPAAGIEPFRRKAARPGDGSWRADDVVLPLPGAWTVRIDILVTDFDIVRIAGEVQIRP